VRTLSHVLWVISVLLFDCVVCVGSDVFALISGPVTLVQYGKGLGREPCNSPPLTVPAVTPLARGLCPLMMTPYQVWLMLSVSSELSCLVRQILVNAVYVRTMFNLSSAIGLSKTSITFLQSDWPSLANQIQVKDAVMA